ncbi:MAG TPA: hypothetical protein VEQ66_04915 [Propionibacteriaceae bacterium]|nr:hypothetical protein [Propionibacteriaceae bacterium]
MVYDASKPPLPETTAQLRARIPGWGADLDHANRPAFPREQPELVSGAHWDFPERQPELRPRERSIEHGQLPPVFGTSCPTKGLSGVLRKYSYRRFSEARAAHWLILLAADRVDAVESHLASFLTLRPDNPITETGVLSEFTSHGIASRFGRRRADLSHQPLDPVIVAGPWLAAGGLGYLAYRVATRAVGR